MAAIDSDVQTEIDPVELAVMSSRFDGIVRQMENTLLRSARSTTLAISRDFSCSMATADGDLIAVADGLPVHVYGAALLNEAMLDAHPDVREGDAFLHNDPYTGGTHAADHSLIVPVFIDGEHMFTAIAKGHQADIGNSIPTTYMPHARDVYEEGALLFPSVKIQQNYEDVDDIIRMCMRRIRVPEIWYGDFLAQVAACRVAERALKDVCARYGRGEGDLLLDRMVRLLRDQVLRGHPRASRRPYRSPQHRRPISRAPRRPSDSGRHRRRQPGGQGHHRSEGQLRLSADRSEPERGHVGERRHRRHALHGQLRTR